MAEVDGNLYWDGNYIDDVIEVSSENCILIQPKISANPPEGMTNFFYEKQLLYDIGVQIDKSSMPQEPSSVPSSSGVQKHKCSICNKSISADRMRGHIAYHIISDHVSSDICGFCGRNSCLNKLVKTSSHHGKNYYRIDSNCHIFFNYKRKPVYSKREKCSNYLAKCDATNCNADIWKYDMVKHYNEKHSHLNVPDEFIIVEQEKSTINTSKNS